jgi:hypothetical protein
VEEKSIPLCNFFFEEFDQIFFSIEKEQKSTVADRYNFRSFELLDDLFDIFILASDYLDGLWVIYFLGYVQVKQLLFS